MRVAVTGGGGFIGSNLAKRLAADGHDAVAIDTFQSAGWQNLAAFDGDVLTLAHRLDIDSVRDVVRSGGAFDVIFHQAAITGVIAADGSAAAGDDVNGFLRNNIEQFRQLLDLAVETGARLVWASSCSVYGRATPPMHEGQPYDPLNVYAFTKVQQERLAARYANRLKEAGRRPALQQRLRPRRGAQGQAREHDPPTRQDDAGRQPPARIRARGPAAGLRLHRRRRRRQPERDVGRRQRQLQCRCGRELELQ
jgi:NAD(P)-dependent dehydrogenase (short-subunit alcohol dehydrogenase family)